MIGTARPAVTRDKLLPESLEATERSRACYTRGALDSCLASCSEPSEAAMLAATPGKDMGGRARASSRQPLEHYRASARQRAASRVRQRPEPASDHLSTGAAGNLIAAADEAARIGLPLNLFVTINWEKGGVADGVRGVGEFWKRAKAWLAYHRSGSALIWTRESGWYHSQHAHLLLHVPKTLQPSFKDMQPRWIAQCALTRGKGHFHTEHVHAGPIFGPNGIIDSYPVNLMNIVNYVLKETEPAGRSELGITRPAHGAGIVFGKRAGCSRNIDKTVRNRQPEIERAARIEDLASPRGWACRIPSADV